jgi:hypothetical protein
VPLSRPQDGDESDQEQYDRRPYVLVGVGHVHDVGHRRLTQMGGEGAQRIGLAPFNIRDAGDLSIGRRLSPARPSCAGPEELAGQRAQDANKPSPSRVRPSAPLSANYPAFMPTKKPRHATVQRRTRGIPNPIHEMISR